MEQKVIYHFLYDDCKKSGDQFWTSVSSAQHLLKQPLLKRNTRKSSFVNLEFIVATSDPLKLLLSIAGYGMNDQRKHCFRQTLKIFEYCSLPNRKLFILS